MEWEAPDRLAEEHSQPRRPGPEVEAEVPGVEEAEEGVEEAVV